MSSIFSIFVLFLYLLQKKKVCNRTDLIADINYEHGRLRFLLLPLGVKYIWEPRPQNKILEILEISRENLYFKTGA